MCNHKYSGLSSGHKCPYPDLFESLKTPNPNRLDVSHYDLILPFDSDGICLFHSKQVEWKREHKFMKRFHELIAILEWLPDIESLDFREFRFVGIPDSTVRMNQTINAFKLKNVSIEKEVNFSGAKFLDVVVWEQTEFKKGGNFVGTQFKDQLLVEKCTIGSVQWYESTFEGQVSIKNSHFTGSYTDFSDGDFQGSVFLGRTIFDDLTLFDNAEFNSSKFQDHAVRFDRVKFDGHLSFKNSVFFCPVEFNRSEFNENAEFLDTVFHPSRSGNRYVSADVLFKGIGVGQNGLLTFEGSDIDNKIFDAEVSFSLDEKVKGIIRFVNVNFQKIARISRERLLQLEKLGIVEIGKGCIKYRYQTEPRVVVIDKDCQRLVLDIANTFANYFSAENGINLGVEIIERLDNSLKYFYFSDEDIGEKEFHDRLASTEKRLWSLLYNGPEDHHHINSDDKTQSALQVSKKNAVINAVDGLADLVSSFLKISIRISFGKWGIKDTQALVDTIRFNDSPVCQPQVLHQVIVNNYSQRVLGAFKVEQSQVVELLPGQSKK